MCRTTHQPPQRCTLGYRVDTVVTPGVSRVALGSTRHQLRVITRSSIQTFDVSVGWRRFGGVHRSGSNRSVYVRTTVEFVLFTATCRREVRACTVPLHPGLSNTGPTQPGNVHTETTTPQRRGHRDRSSSRTIRPRIEGQDAADPDRRGARRQGQRPQQEGRHHRPDPQQDRRIRCSCSRFGTRRDGIAGACCDDAGRGHR